MPFLFLKKGKSMSYEANIEGKQTLVGKLHSIPMIDKNLELEGYAADAKETGDRIAKIKSELAGTDVKYDKSASQMAATNVQEAIDEIFTKHIGKNGSITAKGNLASQRFENGYGMLNKNHSETADYGTQIVDATKDGKTAFLNISALYDQVTYSDKAGNVRDIFHEGNKPFGSYVGNGNNAERVIATGGIGRLILVYNNHHFSFVTPEGALMIGLTDANIRWIESTKAFFLNGNLSLHTDNAAFNENGTTYYYQVI